MRGQPHQQRRPVSQVVRHSVSMASAGGYRAGKLLVIFLVISLASSYLSLVVCQSSAANSSSGGASSASPASILDKSANESSGGGGGGISSPTSTETLLVASEFVDFTEAPTLLFDGTSNLENETSPAAETSPKPPQPQATTTTATTTTISETATTSREEPEPETTTTTIGSASSAEDGNEEPDQEQGGDEEQKVGTTNREPFEPPKNVSQYMDYIETLFHDLRHQIADLFEPHLPQLIRTSQMVQLSASCSYDMLRMALALRQFEPWALRMIDSSGKVPEGIFEGSFTALGSYDECLNTVFGPQTSQVSSSSSSSTNNQTQATQGKYCLVNVSPYLPPKPPADRVERMFQEEANRRNYTKDNQFSRLSPMFYYMKFRIGICLPSSCTESDMDSLSEALSSSLRLNITIPNCRIRRYQPITSHQLVGGLVFASVIALVLGATLMDYSRRKLDRQKRQIVLSMRAATATDGVSVNVDPAPSAAINMIMPRHHQEGDNYELEDQEAASQRRFLNRLNKNWSWLSFSLFTNYRLYFESLSWPSPPSDRKLYSQSRQVVAAAAAAPAASPKQLNTVSNEHTQQMVRCLNGIRVISLCWVIVANSYITLDPRATKRLTKTREAPKDFLFQMVAQASLAIETFFFLSGVLMSLSFARKLKPPACEQTTQAGNRKWVTDQQQQSATSRQIRSIEWLQFYIHRYVRMTPATMLVIAFTMYAYGYGDGPLWFEATHKAHQSCSENWWRHLLHVANFIDTRQMCFIHYWYIAADMQLFLFAPLVMFLIYRYRKLGYALVTLIGAASIGSIFYTTYMRNLPPTLLFYNSDPESRREFGNTIMTKPLTHALPYLVGMLVGKWLTASSTTKTKTLVTDSSISGKSSGLRRMAANPPSLDDDGGNGARSLTTLLGAIATVVALAEVFLPYKWNNSHLPTRFLASLYAAFFRFAWSLVLAYIIMSCRHKRDRRCAIRQAAPVNDQTGMIVNLTQATKLAAPTISQCLSCQSTLLNEAINSYDGNSSKLAITMDRRAGGIAAAGEYDANIIMSSTTTPTKLTRMAVEQEEQVWCLCGSGGNLVNRLLSLDVFTYLSKLSFVAYLIHLPLMSVFIAQTRGLFAFSHTLVIHLALSYLVMTFILSFLLVHIIELPFLTFERYLFEKFFYHPNGRHPNYKSSSDGIHSIAAAERHQITPDTTDTANHTKEPKTCSMDNNASSYTINSFSGSGVPSNGATKTSLSDKL